MILFGGVQTVLPGTLGLQGHASGVPERMMYSLPNIEDLSCYRKLTMALFIITKK